MRENIKEVAYTTYLRLIYDLSDTLSVPEIRLMELGEEVLDREVKKGGKIYVGTANTGRRAVVILLPRGTIRKE